MEVICWIRRYDNYHRPPHSHYRKPDGEEVNHLPMKVSEAQGQAIAQKEILSNFGQYVRRYREGKR